MVTFLAFGVAIREWDTPIGGALMRDSDDPTTVSDVETDLVTHFNPGGLPNATPEEADAVDDSGNTYPTFLDPRVVRDPDVRRPWTLPMAVRYLCYRHNPDQTYVKNPDGSLLDRSSTAGCRTRMRACPTTEHLDSEPSSSPIIRRPARPGPPSSATCSSPTASAWRSGSRRTIRATRTTTLDIFRRQDGSPSTYKDLYLQPRGVGPRPRPDQPRRGPARPGHERGGQRLHGRVGTGPIRGVVHPGARVPDLRRRRLPVPRRWPPSTGTGPTSRRTITTSIASTSSTRRARATGIGNRRRCPRTLPRSMTCSGKRGRPGERLRQASAGSDRRVVHARPEPEAAEGSVVDLDRLRRGAAGPLGWDRDLAADRRRLRAAEGPARHLDQRPEPQWLEHPGLEGLRDALPVRGRQGGRGPGELRVRSTSRCG